MERNIVTKYIKSKPFAVTGQNQETS